jgi:polyisoprenoid-binding protein YceI
MPRILSAVLVIFTLLVSITASIAADYAIDLTHSHVLFMIDHLGFSKMIGLFTDFGGTFTFDPNNVAASKLAVSIKTGSLQTQFGPRDKDLKGADWFNTTEFPEMTFVGTSFTKKDEHTGTIAGNMTVRGVTRPVTLAVVLNKVGQNPLDKINSAGFSARGTLKRSDFGINAFLGPISDAVDIIIEIEGKQKS